MIEIQIHPGNQRRRVRHLKIGRGSLIAAIIAGSVVLVILIGSMVVAPSVVRRSYRAAHLKMMREEKAIQTQRLREHARQMLGLEQLADEHGVRIEKLVAVYGLERDGAPGTGGSQAPSVPGASELQRVRQQNALLARSLERLDSKVEMLAEFEAKHQSAIRQTPAILPIPADQFVVTDRFGWRISPYTQSNDFHAGLDLAAPTGTPVHATADGVVVFAGRYPMRGSVFWWRFGNVVAIDHGGRFVTIYGHCDRVLVKAGASVRQGETIATVGASGWATNSHLHYEVRSNANSAGRFNPLDPQIYILNYQWNDDAELLSRTQDASKERPWEPLPSGMIRGGRKG
jgi:murein DD-endopeptidase MepM/ murein hydrolase activator NlpD